MATHHRTPDYPGAVDTHPVLAHPHDRAVSQRIDELIIQLERRNPRHPATAAARIERVYIEHYCIPVCCPTSSRGVA